MRPISYARATAVADAIATVSADPGQRLPGRWNDRGRPAAPRRGAAIGLVDINDLPLDGIEDLHGGGLRIGALARMSDVAEARGVVERFPMLAQALLLGASAQLRNMASMGGNLLQRTRCGYFRDPASPCNKRNPGTGCSALEGVNRGHAILGTSEHCIATHPSDVAVALVALDAVVHMEAPGGPRAIPIDDFFLLPGDTPEREHPIEHGELIVAIEVPATPIARRSVYLKVRDRESYEFALVSVAAALASKAERSPRRASRSAAWRPSRGAPAAPSGSSPVPRPRRHLRPGGHEELAPAMPRGLNAFKVELAERTIVRALELLSRREVRHDGPDRLAHRARRRPGEGHGGGALHRGRDAATRRLRRRRRRRRGERPRAGD